MFSLAFLVFLSSLISLLGTPLVRRVAEARGWFDVPDGGRKAHPRPVPRIGGVVIAFAFAASYAIWVSTPMRAAGQVFSASFPLVLKLLPAGLLIFVVGLVDDIWGMAAWKKLGFQAVAAIYLCQAGVQIRTLAGSPIEGYFSFGVTVLWLLLCTNAFNLIDGMDGLATGLGLLATSTTLLVALLQGNIALALAVAPLAGSLLGFLRYNLPPASIFLGDSGSLLIGFLLGSYAIVWTQKTATLLGLLAPLMAFAVPLLEVTLSVGRRLLRGKPLFGADKGHIHHRLLDRGWSAKKTILVLHAVGLLAACFAVIQTVMYNYAPGVVVALFVGLVWVAVQSLGYAEFRAAGKVVSSGLLSGVVRNEVAFETSREKILKAASGEDCWAALCELREECGLGSLRARLLGVDYGSEPRGGEGAWEIVVPLGKGDRLVISDDGVTAVRALSIDHFVGIVGDALRVTLRTLRSHAALRDAAEVRALTVRRSQAPSRAADRQQTGCKQGGIRVLFGVNSAFAVTHLIDETLKYYVDRGYSVTVVAPMDGQVELPKGIARKIDLLRIPMEREISPWKDLKTLVRLYLLMREIRPHIADMSTPKAALLGGLAAWAAGVPARIYTIRGLRFDTLRGPKRMILRFCEVVACLSAQRVNVISRSLFAAVLNERLAPERKLVLLGPRAGDGIHPEQYRATAERMQRASVLREEMGFKPNHKVLGFVGRLTRDKGICELLQVFNDLSKENSLLRLLLVGPIEAGDSLPDWAFEMITTHPAINWRGYSRADASLYLAMDVFVFPTHREGLGKVVLEAATSGRPVIATATTGVTDAIEAGVTGLLVPPQDPESLELAIRYLIDNPDTALALGAAGPAHVERYFNIQEHLRRHEQLALGLLRWSAAGASIPQQLTALQNSSSNEGSVSTASRR